MGVTSTGLRYPEGTDPVSAGATNMQNLAADVTRVYPSRNPSGSTAVSPAGAAVAVDVPLRIQAGFATVTLASGFASFAIPNGGKAWTQILYFDVMGAETGTAPRNSNWTVAAAGSVGTFWVGLYVANVVAGSGATNMQYVAIGV
jgi:hypothetical protein